MAISCTLSNHYKYQRDSGNIDFSADVFKIILMDSGYTFDQDTDDTLADITVDQLATEHGYTQDSETLANVTITRDNAGNKSTVSWDDPSWTASGGSIGATNGALIYDDTTGDDTVVGYIDFDYGGGLTIPAGMSLTIKDIELDLT